MVAISRLRLTSTAKALVNKARTPAIALTGFGFWNGVP
jgi:hypothetical protein